MGLAATVALDLSLLLILALNDDSTGEEDHVTEVPSCASCFFFVGDNV